MPKNVLCIVFFQFLTFTVLFSQIPDGYYNSADGKAGEMLKDALYNIIKNHTEKSYGDTRYILDETDVDPINTNNVLTIYSPHSVSNTWDAGTTWNREHVWAKSHGIGSVDNNTKGAGSDLHNLRACIPEINEARNNRWFGVCNEAYFYNNLATGCFTSSTDWVWMPRDEDKGDVARIIFYMATRYRGEAGEPNLELIDYLPANNNTTLPVHGLLSDLLEWHSDDQVSEFEKHRNEVIYSYQKNRNPFIDHPEYVNEIWGTTSISTNKRTSVRLLPNPVTSQVSILSNEAFETLVVYNLIGIKVKESASSNSTLSVEGLPNGQYIMHLSNRKNSIALHFTIIH
jgi:endonuclease I